MPKFVTIGYGDQAGYDATPAPIRDAAHAHDSRLKAAGALMGVAGEAVQVRNPQDGGLRTSSGPYLRADLPVAGFGVLEAPDLAAAIELASHSPCAVANGVIEVWPLRET